VDSRVRIVEAGGEEAPFAIGDNSQVTGTPSRLCSRIDPANSQGWPSLTALSAPGITRTAIFRANGSGTPERAEGVVSTMDTLTSTGGPYTHKPRWTSKRFPSLPSNKDAQLSATVRLDSKAMARMTPGREACSAEISIVRAAINLSSLFPVQLVP